MKANKSTKLTKPQRLLHLLKAIMVLVIICLEFIYGFIISTNILTQLSHSTTWFYVAIFMGCFLIMALIFTALYKMIRRHIKAVTTGLAPKNSFD